MIYFTSDLHFGHKAMVGENNFDHRPFNSIEEMDNTLIKNWNNKVNPEDTVYILGDFSWYKADKTIEILKHLKGHKRLIKGNHDHFLHNAECKKQFESIVDYDEIKVDDKKLILSHYPIHFFNGHYHNNIMLFGHVHSSLESDMVEDYRKWLVSKDIPCEMYNCFCGLYGYAPATLEEIINKNR